ncbi:MAG TPA: G1 family glutamic endopeptidase [Trebonia sp.]|jgi:hypothetical protein
MLNLRKRMWAIAVVLMGVTAAALGLPVGSSVAATVHASSNWPAGIPRLATPSCASRGGGTPLLPYKAESLVGGGYAYDYMIDGKESQYIVPPASFDPKTATVSKLTEYGFPREPASGTLRTNWISAMSTYKSVPQPSLCLSNHKSVDNVIAGKAAGVPMAGTKDSYNWAGAEVDSSSNTYIAAQGSWGQSGVHPCNCTGVTDESSWAGIGGVDDGALLQAGTDMTGSTISAWYEYLHDCVAGDPTQGECGPSEISVGTVTAGATIYTQTSYETSSNVANFYVEESGTSFPIKSLTLDSTYYNGQTAEWIDERPSYCTGGCYKPLTNFLYNDWNEVEAEDTSGTWQNVGSISNRYYDVMINTSNQVLVNPSALCDGCATFTDTWEQAS